MKRISLLSGNPGVGKTTVLVRVVEGVKSKGYCVGGMLSREVRSSGNRVGFEILSLVDSQRGWLAQVDQKEGPQVGKYRVNLFDLNRVGVAAIVEAVDRCEVVAVDEIGPMELFSDSFKEAVTRAVRSKKLVIATVHWREREFLTSVLDKIDDVQWYEVSMDNRERLHELILKEAIDFLESRTRRLSICGYLERRRSVTVFDARSDMIIRVSGIYLGKFSGKHIYHLDNAHHIIGY